LLHNHPHLSSGVCTIGQKWPQYQGLCPTSPIIKKIIITTSRDQTMVQRLIDVTKQRNNKQLKRTKYVIVNIKKDDRKNTVLWDGRFVVRYKFFDVSEERAASSFRVED
jgi:hypothetical protein